MLSCNQSSNMKLQLIPGTSYQSQNLTFCRTNLYLNIPFCGDNFWPKCTIFKKKKTFEKPLCTLPETNYVENDTLFRTIFSKKKTIPKPSYHEVQDTYHMLYQSTPKCLNNLIHWHDEYRLCTLSHTCDCFYVHNLCSMCGNHCRMPACLTWICLFIYNTPKLAFYCTCLYCLYWWELCGWTPLSNLSVWLI